MVASALSAITVCVALTFAASATAGPLEDGAAGYKKGHYATALRLLRPLAEQGNAGAQTNLGLMYAKGVGVPQDSAEAIKWYRKAAEQGYAVAQGLLGATYLEGKGAPQDYAEAVKWYRKAAEQRYAFAQKKLAFMYLKGQGVPQNYVTAHMWFNLAASQGDKDGAKNRDEIERRMTPAQIAEAQKLARQWKPK
jgi:TPR repeat protein